MFFGTISKLGKSANMTLKNFFCKLFDMRIKNAEFDAHFGSIEKVVKKFLQKKVISIKSVEIMYFFTVQYCEQKFSAL